MYASIPLIVIESSVDEKLILAPGIKFFILLLINNVFEFVASVVLLNVACFLFSSVVVSVLVYASIPLIVIESSVDVKFILSPVIKFFYFIN